MHRDSAGALETGTSANDMTDKTCRGPQPAEQSRANA